MDIQYQICTSCVMDTSDPEIAFDKQGVCNHCRTFENVTSKQWSPNEEGRRLLEKLVAPVRETGKGQEYDCIMGLSGGVDSSYLALKVKELGLRPLVVHVDTGWNSELAVSNIEKIVKRLGYELHTHVMDWEEMRDLQVAYLRAGVANQDVPQDHAIMASLYHFAVKSGIRTVLSGGNIATEAIFPDAWHGSAMDAVNLKAIHRKYGKVPLRKFRVISFAEYYVWYPFVKKMRTLRPLNYLPYNKDDATAELERAIGWRSYGRKHGESLFTRFFQNYYLPVKFGYDKRRPHLSTLIVSGQLSRESALKSLEEPLYLPEELEIDLEYFCKKIGIARDEFERLMAEPNRHYSDFPSWDRRYRLLKRAQRAVERLTGRRYNVYS
jgi:N-acetyl sugar amidotransferase